MVIPFLGKTRRGIGGKIVMVENKSAAERPSRFLDAESAYENGGEPALAACLAYKDGVSIVCPEPNGEYLLEELLKQFSKEEIVLYRLAIFLDHWNRRGRKQPLEEYLERQFKKVLPEKLLTEVSLEKPQRGC